MENLDDTLVLVLIWFFKASDLLGLLQQYATSVIFTISTPIAGLYGPELTPSSPSFPGLLCSSSLGSQYLMDWTIAVLLNVFTHISQSHTLPVMFCESCHGFVIVSQMDTIKN